MSVKKWLPGAAVAVLLLAVALLLRGRDQLPATPAAALTALLEAARQQDADAYLRLTDGQLRQSLEQTRREMGPLHRFSGLAQRASFNLSFLKCSPCNLCVATCNAQSQSSVAICC